MRTSRRNFLRISGAGVLASQTPLIFANDIAGNKKLSGANLPFELGIASYTTREFSLEDTIAMTSQLEISNLCLKSMHLPLDLSTDEIKSEAAKVSSAGINLYGGGVIYMKNKEEVDQAFAYAGTAGMKVIVGVPEHKLLDYCSDKVKETGINLAIHNHGPGDEKYPSPESAYELIKDLDPGMGLCMDIGHTVRIGEDPAKDAERFMDRLHDVHIKDVNKADASGETCEIGRGVIDIASFLEVLLKKKYSKVVSFEYEKDGKNPLPGLAESVGYVRGVLDVIA
ncbi:MAG: sugar phosphate isomerase/epimerase family protein [Bacteroides sp.]|nr:sugar phosphate isomerase/epimerase family protein [Bacteroides sp.]